MFLTIPDKKVSFRGMSVRVRGLVMEKPDMHETPVFVDWNERARTGAQT